MTAVSNRFVEAGPTDRLEVEHIDLVLAHDYLTQRGGGERVALELARQFPTAPMLTSVYERSTTFPEFAERDVRASPLNRWNVFRKDPRRAFPLLAPVMSRMPVPDGVLLASSSGWAHGLRARGPKIVYCHNPARWLYQPDDYFQSLPKPLRRTVSAALAPLRAWDRRAARTVDVYLANSTAVARRIRSAYGVEARVVHPPAGLDPAGPTEPVAGVEPGFLLTVGRRRGYKNTELVCRAVEQVPGSRLVAVGGLPSGRWSERLVGVRDITDAQLRWLYANCSAVVAMGHEDFGLSPVEGFGFGKPNIALRAGGYLDSGLEGVTTSFVDVEDAEHLAAAIIRFDPAAFDPEQVRAHGQRFSPQSFGQNLRAVVADVARRGRRDASTPVDARLRAGVGLVTDPTPPHPLHVVYLDHCALMSGGEIALLRTLEALPHLRRTVWLAEDGPLVEPLRRTGAVVEVIPMEGSARSVSRDAVSTLPLRSVLATARYTVGLARRLRRERPDVVHTNSLKSALYGGVAARLAGVPVVWHARDRIADDYLPARTAAVVRAAARWLPDTVLANSQATLETLRLPARRRAVVVPDPYRPTRPARELPGRAESSLRFAMVGRLAPWKGQHVFLEAFAEALRGTPHRAVVVGAALFGEDAYAERLPVLAAELGIADQVDFTGFTDDVEGQLAQVDVLVHASTVPEPFGQVVVEGLAAGLSVIAADAGGPAEILTDGQDGLLVPPDDASALAERLRRVAADPDLRRRLARHGVETARSYLPDALADRFQQVYRDLAGAGRTTLHQGDRQVTGTA